MKIEFVNQDANKEIKKALKEFKPSDISVEINFIAEKIVYTFCKSMYGTQVSIKLEYGIQTGYASTYAKINIYGIESSNILIDFLIDEFILVCYKKNLSGYKSVNHDSYYHMETIIAYNSKGKSVRHDSWEWDESKHTMIQMREGIKHDIL